MSEAKHTPGPWKVGPPTSWYKTLVYGIHGTRRGVVARVLRFRDEFGVLPDDEALANARLIAAAPELLAACKAAVADAEKATNPAARLWGYERMKAAIARAEGREP